MVEHIDVDGMAALVICESLLLALRDRKILPEREISGILADAAAAHSNAPVGDGMEARHKAVVAVIQRMIDVGTSGHR